MNWNNFGVRLADGVAAFVGSWKFIIWQSVILLVWMIVNINHVVTFDPYPFILMNLLLSSQAAYATPMILMSSNRQAIKDREQLLKDLELDVESLQKLDRIEKQLEKLELELKEKTFKKPKTKTVL